jgi:hypothetical protein
LLAGGAGATLTQTARRFPMDWPDLPTAKVLLVTTLPDFNALVRVMDLLHAPYVAEVLDCLQRDVQPADALPDADIALVDGAIRRLVDVTAICEVPSPAGAASRPVLALTAKGREVAPLIQELVAQERDGAARGVRASTARRRQTSRR